MSIVSPFFFALLTVTVLLIAIVPPVARKGVLLASCLVFYLSSDVASAAVGLGIVAANFLFLRALLGSADERLKEQLYFGSIVFNLTLFVGLKLAFEPSAGTGSAPWSLLGVELAYPLGLSFILLMLHAALTDAYSERYSPRARPATYLLYATFFPYVTSGPVERLDQMESQFEGLRKPTSEDLRAGLALIALGLVKKTVVANRLGPYVEGIFAGELEFSATTMAVAIALNAVHLYADFSGYTDIARGAARCLGIDIRMNFDRPFVSRSATEFWRRWHISFSTWLRDYLYMPLAYTLRRMSPAAPSIAIFLTFLVAGFWHRATWNFMLFGLLHGLVLALAFIGLARLTGNPVWDAVGSICIGVLLVLVAVLVGVEVKSLLIGQSAEPEVQAALGAHLVAQPQVAQVYNVITQQLGAEIMVAIKARMHATGSEAAMIEAVNVVERSVHAAFPRVKWVFFEPDVHD